MSAPLLGAFVDLLGDEQLAAWGVSDALAGRTVSGLGKFAADASRMAKAACGGRRIHPDARVSPLANLGPDVVVGPGAVVCEYSTVRGASVLSAGVVVGFGCEVTDTVIGQNTRLGHKVFLGHSIVGRGCHLSADLTVCSVDLWNHDMGHPTREIRLALPCGGACPSGLTKFGAVLGDRVRTGARVTLGPGALVGADTLIYPGVVAGGACVPANAVVRPRTTGISIQPRRRPAPVTVSTIGEPS